MAFQAPNNPKSIPERPLNKGMLLHLPSNSLAEGAVLNAKNLNITQRGLKKREGLSPYSQDFVEYGAIQGITNYWRTTGEKATLVIDEKFPYLVTKGPLTGVYETYSTGTVSIDIVTDAKLVTGSGTAWDTEGLQAEDVIVVGNEEKVINTVDSETSLTVETDFASSYTDSAYEIRKAFNQIDPFYLDWANNGQKIIFADGQRPLRAYDENGLAPFDQDGSYIPNCIGYFNDRIFIGRTQESGPVYQQRIRWSGVGFSNHDSFPAENYIELPYTNGMLLRLVSFSNFLVAYFNDAIYMGRGTNNANLPVQFQKVDTGGIGLVGMRAVGSHIDGHYFVGQDDVYFLSNRGFERIGTPIVREFLENVNEKWRIQVAVDPSNDRVLFATPYKSNIIERVYAYNYKTKGWSWMDISPTSVSYVDISVLNTWESLTDTGILDANTWDTGFDSQDYPTWESLASTTLRDVQVQFGFAQRLWNPNATGLDRNQNPISVEFITRDFDEDAPDINKLWTRMTLKLETPVEETTSFEIKGSIDRGNTWKSLGTLIINPGDDEGHVNFRLSGQLARFRFRTTSSERDVFVITEIVRRVTGKGLEVPGRSTG